MDKSICIEDYYNFKIIESISEDALKKEWDSIKRNSYGYDSGNSWNKIVRHFQFKELYKEELKLWLENPLYRGLPLRSWIYANRKKYINKGYGELTQAEILRAFKITGIHIGYSFHSPFYIKQFIKDYNIKSIYDPCGGWGHRLLGAASENCKYVYNDINRATSVNCIRIKAYFQMNNIEFYSKDAAKFTPQEDYEAVFTCPPYHNVEVYTEHGAENLSYEDFLTWWDFVVKNSCVIKDSCKYFAFIINRTHEDAMHNICLNNNLELIESHILGSSKQTSHLNANSSKAKYEKLLVYKKNN